MNHDVKIKLLKAARKSLETYFLGEKMEMMTLGIRRGAFVTLRKNGELRGCIGFMSGIDDLYKEIISLSREAAFEDFRFPPLSEEDLPLIDIEISVLTEPEIIENPLSFNLGKDGIIFTLNGRRAVYLPQVATETGWNRIEMLQSLSLKAGLPSDSWKSNEAVFMTFQAEVFSESNM